MDESTFRDAYERTAPNLRAYLCAALGDVTAADDLLQEAFCRLLCAALRDANMHQIRSYLYKTARSLIADHRRRIAVERRWRARWHPAEPECPNHDLTLDMERLFAELPPKQQTLLWLAYVEGLSHREIAASLGMKDRSVRVLLYRARKRLAGILQDHGWHPREAP